MLAVAGLAVINLMPMPSSEVAVSQPKQDIFVEPGSVPIGGPFTLVNHRGQEVTAQEYRGRYLLVFFGFTNCPDVCPTTLGDIARTLDLLGEDARAVQPLFVSLDPARDVPEALAEYVKAFHPRIVGLTGTKEQVDAAAKAYKVFYEKVGRGEYQGKKGAGAGNDAKLGDDYLISHQGNTYLMSPEGEYLTHFSYGTKPEEMAETIRTAFEKFGKPTGETG